MQLILGLLLAVALFYLLRQWGRLPEKERKSWGIKIALGGLMLLLLLMVVTGRLHVLAALFAAVVPFFRRLPAILRYLPLVGSLWKGAQQKRGEQHQGRSDKAQRNSGAMTPDEARQVLGVEAGASRDEIVAAHRRLMQKIHPDHGGSDYLAARVNEAKSVLLEGMS